MVLGHLQNFLQELENQVQMLRKQKWSLKFQ